MLFESEDTWRCEKSYLRSWISCTSLRRIVACASSYGPTIIRPFASAEDQYWRKVFTTFQHITIAKCNTCTHLPRFSQRALHPPVCYLAANRPILSHMDGYSPHIYAPWSDFHSEKIVKPCKISCQLGWMRSLQECKLLLGENDCYGYVFLRSIKYAPPRVRMVTYFTHSMVMKSFGFVNQPARLESKQ